MGMRSGSTILHTSIYSQYLQLFLRDEGSNRREIITVRGQSYVYRLPKY
jgi:hypothetical protein